jgi:serine phosphatase RsbU (regulator of sigma subunit)
MSMMGVNLLERIFAEHQDFLPHEVIIKLDHYVAQAFSRPQESIRDGMDAACCAFSALEKCLYFSGAKSPLFIVHKEEGKLIKPSKVSIGGETRLSAEALKLHKLPVKKEDTFFLYSDGYQDQFGGAKGKKFMSTKFRALLAKHANLPMEAQKQALALNLQHWMEEGHEKQTDDVLVVGFRP